MWYAEALIAGIVLALAFYEWYSVRGAGRESDEESTERESHSEGE